ncbi:MAG TPA: hypothetical protein VKB50_28540 [Vicinamibacterales bacterium]|nr:hypothetical protein [Vicinamibacterales bacterium]
MLSRAFVVTCVMLVAGALLPSAQSANSIRIWKVGSPYTGDTPTTKVPPTLQRAAARLGYGVLIEAFPAKGFARRFRTALATASPPDVIAFDNFGVLEGSTTPRGKFEGIGDIPGVRSNLVQVTASFDDLLTPTRGWAFLFATSANHAAAKALALRSPSCPATPFPSQLPTDLASIAPAVARAYVQNDPNGLAAYFDPDRLSSAPRSAESTEFPAGAAVPGVTKDVRLCGGWGNDRLAIVRLTASYTTSNSLGELPVLLVLRKPSSRWQLLSAARDPISTTNFALSAPALAAKLSSGRTAALPLSARLIAPADGEYPKPRNNERFGNFEWQPSSSDDVVAEVAEFSYFDDARLFVTMPSPPLRGPKLSGRVSAGSLWSTRSRWTWRVWSITRAGDVVFSDARTFPN